MTPYRILEHTADLGIEAEGATADEVLAQAALALTTILTGIEHPHRIGAPDREIRFAVEAPDLEALAVAFLSELLWQFESQSLLWLGGGVLVTDGREGTVRAEGHGNAVVHDAKHGRGVEVKAVTYHKVEFGRLPKSGWRLRVILDI